MTLEEPRIERALRRLMETLDQELPKTLLVTCVSELEKEVKVVEEAEQYLAQPDMRALQERTANARKRVENALRKWLEAWDGLLSSG